MPETDLHSTCADILTDFTRLDSDASARSLIAWKPAICDIYRAYSAFPREEFQTHLDIFYGQAVEMLGMDNIDLELRRSLEQFLRRVGSDVIFTKANGKQRT